MNNYLSSLKQGLSKHKITLDKNNAIHKLLCKYIDSLIFNIVSIASIITLINNCKCIKKPTIKLVNSYITEKCDIAKNYKGGTSLPSEYFGINSGLYNSANPTGDILGIDFSSGIIRPQIGGGGKYDNNYIILKINEILDYYKLDASKVIKMDLYKIINSHINCFMGILKINNKSPLTITAIKNIIKSNKSLDIFK